MKHKHDDLSITLIKSGWYFPWTLVWTPGPFTIVITVFLLAAVAGIVSVLRKVFGWQ